MSKMPDVLAGARALLENETPLPGNCGRLCGARCCRPMEGENTGMLLFPGEEAYYAALPDYAIAHTPAGLLLTCPGQCRREDRPLSCRLFPLLPLLREEGVRVGVDLRAKPVCPLARQGVSGVRQEFVEAVRACGQLLAEDDAQRRFLLRLTAQQDDLRALRKQFGGKGYV